MAMREMEEVGLGKEKTTFAGCSWSWPWAPMKVVILLSFVAPARSLPYMGKASEPDGTAQRLQQEQPFPIDNESLFVDISNNMQAGDAIESSVINVDCVAESSTREPLDFLGHGIVKPSQAVIYYMNLRVFTPDIVSCTFEWAGKKKTLDMYDNRNLELQYKYVRWSVMENGFSLYHPVSERFHLYKTWT